MFLIVFAANLNKKTIQNLGKKKLYALYALIQDNNESQDLETPTEKLEFTTDAEKSCRSGWRAMNRRLASNESQAGEQ